MRRKNGRQISVLFLPPGWNTSARMAQSPKALKAALALLLATALWGTTYLLMKVLGQCQQTLAPEAGSCFFSSASLLVRFGIGALILLPWNIRSLRNATRAEVGLGVGLGVFGGLGVAFQMDGVQHAPASTCAFLIQCYCMIVPVWVAVRQRRWPSMALASSCLLVLGGVAVLAQVDWSAMRLGRGETESIIASIIFTGQILWLERPQYAQARSGPATVIMFVTVALIMAPIALASAGRPSNLWRVFASPAALAIMVYLTVVCTAVAFTLMNAWQRYIPATYASLIYGSEPLFTSVFALFMPTVLSAAAGVDYANESLTCRLIIGGGLITAANLIVFWQAVRMACAPPRTRA